MEHRGGLWGRMGLVCVASLALLFSGCTLDDVKDVSSTVFEQVDEPQDGFFSARVEPVIVSRVIDGDTVDISGDNGKERVRLLLIDTPESVHPTEPVQKFGKEASEFASSVLLPGQMVFLERGENDKDKYGRTLGYIWLDDEKKVNFNQLMIEEGYARVAYVYVPNTRYLDVFERAENDAKAARLNIWSIDGYVTRDGFDMSAVRE